MVCRAFDLLRLNKNSIYFHVSYAEHRLTDPETVELVDFPLLTTDATGPDALT